MKKLLTIFFITSISFGLIMGLLFQELELGITVGFFFGLAMAVMIGIINKISMKSIGESGTSSVKQEKVIELTLPCKPVFELCKKAVLSIKGAKITYENEQEGIIRAKTAVNALTWGDTIVVNVEKINAENSKVHIQSKPAVPTTVVDYGKNLKNVKAISSYLMDTQKNITL
ncbi:hypothetical protein [Metabacillus sp. B2-18]|uniref:hypothetical protein n=1 Tax=Metabacillus sp. B2-18 TaxID=2897333 RepID=UPI001E562295|nr:hypothetical protein [Metabacillus sp. B2-18]UGB30523.1 hypothetical protein LPC09_22970 [Metabacillus sp. B2-18]